MQPPALTTIEFEKLDADQYTQAALFYSGMLQFNR